MSDEALRDAIAQAIHAAYFGPDSGRTVDPGEFAAADAVLGLVAEQIASERDDAKREALADAQAGFDKIPTVEWALNPDAAVSAVVRRLATEAP